MRIGDYAKSYGAGDGSSEASCTSPAAPALRRAPKLFQRALSAQRTETADRAAAIQRELEVFAPGPEVQLQRPGTAVLMMHVPVGLGDRIGLKQAVGAALRLQLRRAG